MIENRRAYRLPFRTKFIFATQNRVYTGNSINISSGGIMVNTFESQDVARETRCRCLFLLNAEEEPVFIDAVVKRVIAPSVNPDESPGLAFNFIDRDPADRERRLQFMENNRKNFEVAATILSSGEPDLNSLEPLRDQMHLPPYSDLGELRFYVERTLRATEMIEKQNAAHPEQ